MILAKYYMLAYSLIQHVTVADLMYSLYVLILKKVDTTKLPNGTKNNDSKNIQNVSTELSRLIFKK